jgi:vacuolar-type H+-ATPase subunit E/Vma4
MTVGAAADALALVTERLQRDAEARADRIRAAARAEAAAIVARAREQEATTIAAASAVAAEMAGPLTDSTLRQAHETARSALLAAQREACEELRAHVQAAVAGLPDQPDWDQLGQRIAGIAAEAAGPDARLSPEPDGGFVARTPGVVVDCSLSRLADLALAELGARVRELWAP